MRNRRHLKTLGTRLDSNLLSRVIHEVPGDEEERARQTKSRILKWKWRGASIISSQFVLNTQIEKKGNSKEYVHELTLTFGTDRILYVVLI